MYGYDTIDDYYNEISSNNKLPMVTVPLLGIGSKDDGISQY